MSFEVVAVGIALHFVTTEVVGCEIYEAVGNVHQQGCHVASVESPDAFSGDHTAHTIECARVAFKIELSLLFNGVHWCEYCISKHLVIGGRYREAKQVNGGQMSKENQENEAYGSTDSSSATLHAAQFASTMSWTYKFALAGFPDCKI